jgi:hypothetical protein
MLQRNGINLSFNWCLSGFSRRSCLCHCHPSYANANRFPIKHYIVETQKHAVLGPFSNEVGEKSSICGPKASATYGFHEKKRRNREDSGASRGRQWGKGTKNA